MTANLQKVRQTSVQINQNFGTVCHTEDCVTFLRLAAKLSKMITNFWGCNLKIQHRMSVDLNGLKSMQIFQLLMGGMNFRERSQINQTSSVVRSALQCIGEKFSWANSRFESFKNNINLSPEAMWIVMQNLICIQFFVWRQSPLHLYFSFLSVIEEGRITTHKMKPSIFIFHKKFGFKSDFYQVSKVFQKYLN